jgi:hypothetical protein
MIQHHHIFPKSELRGRYEKSEINEIANMAFISGGTNREISFRSADVYLADILKRHGKQALESHCIPVDPNLLKIESFFTANAAMVLETANHCPSGSNSTSKLVAGFVRDKFRENAQLACQFGLGSICDGIYLVLAHSCNLSAAFSDEDITRSIKIMKGVLGKMQPSLKTLS